MSAAASKTGATVDIGRVLDDGPFTGMQQLVVLLASLAIVLDGFDGQLIGYAIPDIIKEWGITRSAFAPTVAAGLVGMGIGSAFGGWFADRFGRRMAVVGSVFLFGAATCAIGLAPDVLTIAVLRFIAGLGIGGALPTATTITAEFTPARRRTLAVTATIVCVPLGGMLAGLFAGVVLPLYGWRGLFLIGGAIPMLAGVLFFFKLPESPRFLARHSERWVELGALLSRMKRSTTAQTVFTDLTEQAVEKRAGFGALFATGRVRDTLAIWAAFFMCLLTVYSAFSWLPTMLSAEGLPTQVAGAGLTAWNLGGVIGGLVCAMVIARFGSRWPMALAAAGAAAMAFLLKGVDVGQNTQWLIFGLGVVGMFVNAVQCTLYALCAYIYPTNIRATGTAGGLSFGRLGAILSAFVGAMVITAGGAAAYLTLLGGSMCFVLIALLTVKRHIPQPASMRVTKPVAAAPVGE
ncbi:MFS transporter [Azohydromonas australica]|uniref:MFS transporter n=1 Tax=Azohydromonas australica TaxID=364039 RepID=UPI0005BB1898|nr:MFS transporter [Azohydromonas australica]